MSEVLPLLVLGPLLVAGVTAIVPARAARWTTLAGAILWTGLATVVAIQVGGGRSLVVTLGAWERPVGISLRADGLAAVMVLTTAVVALGVAVHACADPEACGSRFYWPLWSALVGSLNAVYLAADLFNTYVALELLTVTAVGMIALSGRPALRAALRYLLLAVLGSLAFLMAVAIVYAESGTLSLLEVDLSDAGPTPMLVALALATVGMGVKTALWPLHGWLPPAHAAAPAAVSPLMSALAVKGSLVVLLRWWTEVVDLDVPATLLQAVGLLGAVAIVHGSITAARQDDLKRVVASSTVAQVGYLLVALPLLAAGAEAGRLAWQGMVLLIVAHALAKAAMFLAAGALARAHGTTDLTAIYVGRVLSMLLVVRDDDAGPATLPPRPAALRWPAMVLVLLALLGGLRPLEVAELAEVEVPAAVVR